MLVLPLFILIWEKIMVLLQKLSKLSIQKFFVFLLSACSVFTFSLGFLSVNAAEPFDYRSAHSWVCNPDTSKSNWISGTSSTHGNIYCGITINAQDEFIDIYGNNSTVGYNAGLVVVDFLIKSGDSVSFNYDIGSFGDKFLLYGLKRAVNTSGLYTHQNYFQSADFVLTENALWKFKNLLSALFRQNFTGRFDFDLNQFVFATLKW